MRSGRARNIALTPISRSRAYRSTCAAGSSGVVTSRVRRGRCSPAQPLHAASRVVPRVADHGDVEDGDRDGVRVPPGALRGATHRGDPPREQRLVGRDVARVAESTGDAQRPGAGAAHENGEVADRTRVEGGLGERNPLTRIRFRAWRPEGAHGLDRRGQRVEPLPGRRERHAEPQVLPFEPARADPAERPPAGEHVQRCGLLGDDPRMMERHGRHQRPQPQVGVERREVAERHPRLGDRVPGPGRPAGSGRGGP